MLSDLHQGRSGLSVEPTVPMNGSLARQNKSPLGSQAVKSSPLKTSPRLIDKLSDFPPALEDPAVFGQRCYQLQGSAGLGAKWFDAGVHGVEGMEQERSDSTSTKNYRLFGQQANRWSLSGRTGPLPLLSKHAFSECVDILWAGFWQLLPKPTTWMMNFNLCSYFLVVFPFWSIWVF